jgi:hypothetical protein
MYTQPLLSIAETAQTSSQIQDRERAARLRGVLTELSIRDENALFEHTRGVSANNHTLGYVPGYLNRLTGEQSRSRYADGSPAPIHLLDGLPEEWIETRDAQGRALRTCAGIVAGFIRDGRFYTREEAVRSSAH